MAITIDGDSGISGVNGSAATPALQGTDTNTGIVFGTDTVQVSTGGSTRATVDSSGRLGIGTSSPVRSLHVAVNGSDPQLRLQDTSASESIYTAIEFNGDSSRQAFIGKAGSTDLLVINDNNSGALRLYTNATERMRIHAAGQITTPNQPSFQAQRSGSYGQSGTDDFAPYNSTQHNRGSHYSTSTYRFTAPVAGHYLFFANAHRAGGNFGSISLRKNNSTRYSFTEYESYDNNAHHYSVAIVDLAVNDYVHVQGTNYNLDPNGFFGGYLLG